MAPKRPRPAATYQVRIALYDEQETVTAPTNVQLAAWITDRLAVEGLAVTVRAQRTDK